MSDRVEKVENAELREPDFSEWGGEARMMSHLRRSVVNRIIRFGEDGWLFSDEVTGLSDPIGRAKMAVTLMTLATQGLIESDLDNPHVVRVTELGRNWYETKS